MFSLIVMGNVLLIWRASVRATARTARPESIKGRTVLESGVASKAALIDDRNLAGPPSVDRARLNIELAETPIYGGALTSDRGDFLHEMGFSYTLPPDVPSPANGVSFSDREVLQAYPFLIADNGTVKSGFLETIRENMQQEWNIKRSTAQGMPSDDLVGQNSVYSQLFDVSKARFDLLWRARGKEPVDRSQIRPSPSSKFANLVPDAPTLKRGKFGALITVLAGVQSMEESGASNGHDPKFLQKLFGINGVSVSYDQASLLLRTPLNELVQIN